MRSMVLALALAIPAWADAGSKDEPTYTAIAQFEDV